MRLGYAKLTNGGEVLVAILGVTRSQHVRVKTLEPAWLCEGTRQACKLSVGATVLVPTGRIRATTTKGFEPRR